LGQSCGSEIGNKVLNSHGPNEENEGTKRQGDTQEEWGPWLLWKVEH
jgi:hypothetical protein